jgi:PAT family beta-lactamase induction signal transducer AmpG
MRTPDLLASKWGRLAAFFFLYLTEGIPLGFTANAVATQMRRQGLGPAEIGTFVGALYLPWGMKWAFGPIVDTVYSRRFGRRRGWIVVAQLLMVATLLAGIPIDYRAQLGLFTALIIVHNVFGAIQDVAIDALAVSVLSEEERGLANGLMFAGSYTGQAVGGAGVLFLIPYIGFQASFVFVAAWILAVTVFVALPLKERAPPPVVVAGPSILAQIVAFLVEAFKSMFLSRGALAGLVFAFLPAGAYALSLSLSSNLAVELGMDDSQIATLTLWSTIISALCCVAGGAMADRFGRRRMLALYLVGTTIPTLFLAWQMDVQHWIMPVDLDAADRPVVPAALVSAFWMASLVFAVFQGLMYGTRTALFMDITNPVVAATQFTAYMAILNFVTSYTANWQGHALESWGYPVTLTLDAVVGLVSLPLLLMMKKRVEPVAQPA